MFSSKPWACSVSDINWRAKGVSGNKLEYLTSAFYHYQAPGARQLHGGHSLLDQTSRSCRHGAQSAAGAGAATVALQAVGRRLKRNQLKLRRFAGTPGSAGGAMCPTARNRLSSTGWPPTSTRPDGSGLQAITARERYSRRV